MNMKCESRIERAGQAKVQVSFSEENSGEDPIAYPSSLTLWLDPADADAYNVGSIYEIVTTEL